MASDPNPLETLALARFETLREAERRLLREAPQGRRVNCGPEGYSVEAPENDPRFARDWGPDSEIRAALLRWLCTDADARKLVDPTGLRIVSAKFDARIDLSFVSLPFPLRMACCWLPEGIALSGADLPTLALMRCWIGPLDLFRLLPGEAILMADGARIKGTVNLAWTTINGTVGLYAADIGGSLLCDGAALHRPGARALVATVAKIGGAAMFTGQFRCEGTLWLYGSRIGNNLECDGAHLKRGLYSGSTGDRSLNDAIASQPGEIVLMAEAATVGGHVQLRRGFIAEGVVRLYAIQIGGNLEFDGAALRPPYGVAVTAENATIKGSATLRRDNIKPNQAFRAQGEIRLRGAVISGDLDLTDAALTGDFAAHLFAPQTQIGGSLRMGGVSFHAHSNVNLAAATCNSLVDHPLQWPAPGHLALDGFVYRRLENPVSAPARLDWLRAQLPADKRARRGSFRPQPYRQLAQVLRAAGHDSEARAVLIGMALDRRKYALLGFWSWFVALLLWHTTRNGYRPLRAVIALLVVWTISFGVFRLGENYALMGPTDRNVFNELEKGNPLSGSYPPFNAVVYAIDLSLPIISLGERDKWQPLATPLVTPAPQDALSRQFPALLDRLPTILSVWRWLAIALGWFLASMLVAGVTGLVARD